MASWALSVVASLGTVLDAFNQSCSPKSVTGHTLTLRNPPNTGVSTFMTGADMFGPRHDLQLLQKWAQEDTSDDTELRRDDLARRYFFERLLFTPVNSEWTLLGCSFSRRGNLVLLVVKGIHEGTQYVAFITEQTTTRCVVVFCRQWLEGRVKWHKDKFAQT